MALSDPIAQAATGSPRSAGAVAASPRSTSRLLATSAFRVTALVVAAFVVMAGTVVGTLFWRTNAILTRQALEMISQEARGFEAIARAGDIGMLAQSVTERSRTAAVGSALLILVDAGQQKLAGNLARWPDALGPGKPGGTFRYPYALPADEQSTQRVAAGLVIPVGNGARLLVARDIEEQRALIDGVRSMFLWGFGILGLTALAGGLLASRLMLGRVAAITETGATIMSGDLSRRIPLSGSDDEFDHLSGSLNVMLDRIEQLMNGMREVSDNIAHDLKTPLNRLRNRAEAALRDHGDRSSVARALERVIEDADDLIKTFDALLLIARLEASATAASLEPFDLSLLVRDIAELYEPVADQAGHRVALKVPARICVRANRQLIGQAIANLLDNALKYGASAGSIVGVDVLLELIAGPGGVRLSVSDCGGGISSIDRARVMKRFVRLDQSRSRPGTGLGLSLVAAVAKLHGGKVSLEDNRPGLRVEFALPSSAMVSEATAPPIAEP